MCGIIGYSGSFSAQKILLDGLEQLEYRGYDSAGVALQGEMANCFCAKKPAGFPFSGRPVKLRP